MLKRERDEIQVLEFPLSAGTTAITNHGLPKWAEFPVIVSPQYTQSFDNEITNQKFKLSRHCLDILTSRNITHLFPVQQELIPRLFSSRFLTQSSPNDILVSASTGSGKTLAYVIPVCEALYTRVVQKLLCLVVLPTKDLATQVYQQFDLFCQKSDLRATLAVGGQSNDYKNTDILVCTPGKLLDVIEEQRHILDSLRFLILDESDRLMNQYFDGWVERVFNHFPPIRSILPFGMHSSTTPKKEFRNVQKLLFSATLSTNPQKLESLKLLDPIFILVGESRADKYSVPVTLFEEMLVTKLQEKPMTLLSIFHSLKLTGALIFVKSILNATRLATLINAMSDSYSKSTNTPLVTVAAVTSDMSLKDRKKIYARFAGNEINALVCTDILARGMDLGECVSVVINYDTPSDIVTYIHRVGRTARAGKEGRVISLLEVKEVNWFKSTILKGIIRARDMKNKNLKSEDLKGYVESFIIGLKILELDKKDNI